MKSKTELPMMFARSGVVAKVVAVSSGVLGSLALFTCVVPELRESHERFLIAMLILFVASVSVSAICAGIVRSSEAARGVWFEGRESRRTYLIKTLVYIGSTLLLLFGALLIGGKNGDGRVYLGTESPIGAVFGSLFFWSAA